MFSEVRANRRRTSLGVLYIGVLGVLGVSLAVAGYALELGFCAYGTSGFFLFMTALGTVSTIRGGGAWVADCPTCDAPLTSDAQGGSLRGDKVVRCPSCKRYHRGTDVLEPVECGYVHPEPVFEVLLPDTAVWPDGCAQCGGVAARYLDLSSASPSKLVSVSGNGRRRVFRERVPVCDRHKEPIWIWSNNPRPTVLFRSFEMFEAFVGVNASPVHEAGGSSTGGPAIKHADAREFAKAFGPGEHLNGLLNVPDGDWLESELDDWLGGPASNRVALAYTGLGDILYFRDLSERAREQGLDDYLVKVACDFSLLRARYGVADVIAKSAVELLYNLQSASFAEQVLGGGLFAEGVQVVGRPTPRQILGFVPALVLGGSEHPDNLQRVSASEHWELLRQMGEPVEQDVAPTRCRVHDHPLITVDGWRSHMSSLPSHTFMDFAEQNPFCLNIGEYVIKPEKPNTSPASLRYCEACEAGMAKLWAEWRA
ncbi:MAG: hypothetical protein ACI9MC_003421 [Kiritimatiellia bacterium]|jgi:hypothetical protein